MSQRIMITGATRGIGLELSRCFLERGERVWAGFRASSNRDQLEELAQKFPSTLVPIEIDVVSDESTSNAAERFSNAESGLDILVNNAALLPDAGGVPLTEVDFQQIRDAFETNTLGPLRVVRAFLPFLHNGVEPRIANITSGMASLADRDEWLYYAYSISKTALNMASRILAVDPCASEITTVIFSPGWVKTEMGGPDAPLSVEESATALTNAILNLSPGDNGLWLDRFGTADTYRW